MWVTTNHDVDTWRSEEHQNYCTIKNIYITGGRLWTHITGRIPKHMLKQSTERLQILQRPSVTFISFYEIETSHLQPPSAHQPSESGSGNVASSIAAGRVIKGLATTALWKHLGLAASDEGLWQQQPAGCDAAMSGVALVHIGLVSLEMLAGSVSKDIGFEYCFGMLITPVEKERIYGPLMILMRG